ncbi:MAG TPA: glycoside hydrolase N-terminal domain-containing protein, partial [Chitinispirillaceae bacterium]|nr:glycoside hydrolase N-terminal domain-containing protein [Chitinispirillaceae bacterium]
MKKGSLLLLSILATSAFADLTLWYNKSATKFEEAVPIGNGRLGGMVYGTVGKDRISLNECTIWNGAPGNNNKSNASSFSATLTVLPEAVTVPPSDLTFTRVWN